VPGRIRWTSAGDNKDWIPGGNIGGTGRTPGARLAKRKPKGKAQPHSKRRPEVNPNAKLGSRVKPTGKGHPGGQHPDKQRRLTQEVRARRDSFRRQAQRTPHDALRLYKARSNGICSVCGRKWLKGADIIRDEVLKVRTHANCHPRQRDVRKRKSKRGKGRSVYAIPVPFETSKRRH
jgi:hypothetical protein